MTTTNETENTAREHQLSTADFATAATDKTPVERQRVDRAASESENGRREALFPGSEAQGFQGRWGEIQASFVDEPQRSVEQADALVAEVMQRLAQVFADERDRLEKQWDRGEDSDTEALRLALRRYRSFFDRLLSL
jgi:hypothetical protein